MIFESHAHYDDEAFDADREELLSSMAGAGVGTVLNVAADLKSVETTLELAKKWPFVYAALGVHPSSAGELTEESLEWLRKKLTAEKAVAVGEIGLDYYWDREEEVRDRQKYWFARQLNLARGNGPARDRPFPGCREGHAGRDGSGTRPGAGGRDALFFLYERNCGKNFGMGAGISVSAASSLSKTPESSGRRWRRSRWRGFCWKRTARIWLRSQIGESATIPETFRMWSARWRSSKAFLKKR